MHLLNDKVLAEENLLMQKSKLFRANLQRVCDVTFLIQSSENSCLKNENNLNFEVIHKRRNKPFFKVDSIL